MRRCPIGFAKSWRASATSAAPGSCSAGRTPPSPRSWCSSAWAWRCWSCARPRNRARPATGSRCPRCSRTRTDRELGALRHTSLLVLLAGLPLFVLALAEPYVTLVRRAGVLSRAPDRAPHRRVVEHARAVSGRASRREGAERSGVLHDRGRRRRLHPAAQERPVSRPHLAHRVRRRSLRHHAVHDRLRQRPAERVAHQRLERVHALSQSGHDHRARPSIERPICSAPSISPTRRAT